MSISFVLGASGSGKSRYIYEKIIKESLENKNTNYILLVPEQYSMVLQRKMVLLHPANGTMNIDVIGFNRLAYRVFDELNVKTNKVLEDFGKSMLIRQAAAKVKDELDIYGTALDKPGFIDEMKSLMSQLYQYDVAKDKLGEIIDKLHDEENPSLLEKKLSDMNKIFNEFGKRLGDEYIVAEELSELLSKYIGQSSLIKNSVIVMDGFTGFTPIQLNCIEQLMKNAKHVYTVLTIDKKFYNKKIIKEHELFHLTRQTMDSLIDRANKNGIPVCEDVFIEGDGYKSDELLHLERNIFRFPYEKYSKEINNINISAYKNIREEIGHVSALICDLVRKKQYRYKDFAIITGQLESMVNMFNQIMPQYDIPYFIDSSQPVKNNPYIDALCHYIRAVDEGFSYESIFAFLKSGVTMLDLEEVDELENYVLAKGIKSFFMWQRSWDEAIDEQRQYVLSLFEPFIDEKGRLIKKGKISLFVEKLNELMKELSYEDTFATKAKALEEAGEHSLSKLYEMLYQKLFDVLDKMNQIMAEEVVTIDDFKQLFELGISDVSLGLIPATLDMVIVGDITRTRLDDVKVLFVLDVNDGIIPASASKAQIISDRDKQVLAEYGYELAPTEKMNAYIEQFYLYVNMTKPMDKLYISYTCQDLDNGAMRPSYIIDRICNLFPGIEINTNANISAGIYTKEASYDLLTTYLAEIAEGNNTNSESFKALYKLFTEISETEFLNVIKAGAMYNNIPAKLADQIYELIKVKMLTQSVSKLEKYASCAYSYFLRYIIGLKERAIKEVNNISVGNILHGAMERVYRYVYDNLENDWTRVSDDYRDKLAKQFVEQLFDNEFEYADKKMEYLKEVLVRVGVRTARMLSDISSKDVFKPEYFEYKFEEKLEHKKNSNITLVGTVDRGDIFIDDANSLIKYRIIDYKSGAHEFKLNELYDGISLQLAVYLNVMQEVISRDGDAGRKNYKVEPDGMYYYHMHDPFVEAKDELDAEKKRAKELAYKGFGGDKEAIFTISKFVMKKAAELSDSILEGNIDKRPVYNGKKTGCDYCEFKAVCRFDNKYGQNDYKYLKFKGTKAGENEAYEQIKKELGGDL